MRHISRQFLLRFGLVAFLALDVLGLVALFYQQAFGVGGPVLWVLSAVVVVAALPLLLRFADGLTERRPAAGIIPSSGVKIP